MAAGVSTTRDKLGDFERFDFIADNLTRSVFKAGQGPAVIIVHEIPGITPEVARFARWVRDAGFTVYLPSLLGSPGKPNSSGYQLNSILRACISREFSLWSDNKTSPVVSWLNHLAQRAHAESGGKGVGALGMCLTGNFALAMMVDPVMLAPVLCQPSLPVGKAGGTGVPADEMAVIRDRLEREDLTVRGYRFEGDALCKAARFDALSKSLGPRFIGEALPDSAMKQGTFVSNPHAVVTTHLVDEQGSLTRAKVDEIIGFFRQRLI